MRSLEVSVCRLSGFLQGGAEFLGDFESGGPSVFGAFSFAGFAKAENVAAVGGEILFAAAGVAVEGRVDSGSSFARSAMEDWWSRVDRTENVKEVAIGPVVSFDERPES